MNNCDREKKNEDGPFCANLSASALLGDCGLWRRRACGRGGRGGEGVMAFCLMIDFEFLRLRW